MRLRALRARPRRRPLPRTTAIARRKRAVELARPAVAAEQPNQKWIADFTRICNPHDEDSVCSVLTF